VSARGVPACPHTLAAPCSLCGSGRSLSIPLDQAHTNTLAWPWRVAYIKPNIPKEFLEVDKVLLDVDNKVITDRVKQCEKLFWNFWHRLLPASDHPRAENAFKLGILLSCLV